MNFNKENGITLVALVVTIIVLLIIAGIGINTGMSSLEKVKLEELRTNMLLIEAKAREYLEEANFKIGKETDITKIQEIKNEIYVTNNKLEKANNTNVSNNQGNINLENCYVVTQESLNLWGLNEIKLNNNEKYLVEFKENEMKVEIYNTNGYNGKYSLSEIESNS